jgi:hypothetical protein
LTNRFYHDSQQISAKIRAGQAEFFHANGRTDKHEKASTFYDLADATKMNVLDLKIIYYRWVYLSLSAKQIS